MVQRHVRLDPVRPQLVDQIVVELHTLWVDAAAEGAIWQQPRPRDREAVVPQPEPRGVPAGQHRAARRRALGPAALCADRRGPGAGPGLRCLHDRGLSCLSGKGVPLPVQCDCARPGLESRRLPGLVRRVHLPAADLGAHSAEKFKP